MEKRQYFSWSLLTPIHIRLYYKILLVPSFYTFLQYYESLLKAHDLRNKLGRWLIDWAIDWSEWIIWYLLATCRQMLENFTDCCIILREWRLHRRFRWNNYVFSKKYIDLLSEWQLLIHLAYLYWKQQFYLLQDAQLHQHILDY